MLTRIIIAGGLLALAPVMAVLVQAQTTTQPAATRTPATRPSRMTDAERAARIEQEKKIYAAARERERAEMEQLVPSLRQQLLSSPREAVDRLNRSDMQRLLGGGRYAEVEEFAIAGSIAIARDTWGVEQLNRFRVRALLDGGKPAEALSAARALFNVAGMGSVPHDLRLLSECLAAAYPTNRGLANRFRLQQLAGAQPDVEQRKKALEGLGNSVLAEVPIDPKPFESAIAGRRSASDFDTLYGVGNLLLLSGRVAEAREVFDRAYKAAPPTELNYASEAIAKVIKAEDAAVGRANDFVAAITAAKK